jgi:hypothetical protein
MPIDIDKLTEAELIDLNHRIVERLRFLQQMKAHAKMLEFKIGDRVAFRAEGGGAGLFGSDEGRRVTAASKVTGSSVGVRG